VDKTIRISDWEGELSTEQLQYAALDSILPVAVYHYLKNLKKRPDGVLPIVVLWNKPNRSR